MRSLLAKALHFLDRRHRRAWLGLIPLSVTTAALEALGAAAVFALIRMIDDPERAATLPLVSTVLGVFGERTDPIVAFAALVAVFYVAKNTLRLGEIYARRRCAAATEVSIATRLLGRYLAAPYVFHLRRNSARLIRNATNSARAISHVVLLSATAAVSEALIVIGILAVVISSAPRAALLASGVVGVSMVGLLRLTQSQHTRWGRRSHALNAGIVQTLQQSLGGVKEVKVLGREEFFVADFARRIRELARLQVFRGMLEMAPRLLVETGFVVGVVALIVGTQRAGSGGDLVPLLGLFAYAGLRILPSLHWIVYHLNDLRFGTAAIDEVYHDWTTLEFDGVAAVEGPRAPFDDRIALSDVSYVYPDGEREAVSGIDLEIRRGESVGIVGATGAGKSTLIDLVLGLLVPTEGRVAVDGRDIHADLSSWQRQIGYVPQSIYLTDDTIRRNIAFGVSDAAIDAERVEAAARLAQIEEFIEELPDRLDTVVGERGVRLSGGQRQRIAVARALYHDPEVLVFDEATAALDPQTERELTREIESLQRKKTLLIIAHRLSTVRHCDRLVFLDRGRVAGVAPYDELYAGNAAFRELAAGPA